MSFEGKKNVYLCEKCGHGFTSKDVDEGVTPFMTRCLNATCGGTAFSLCYKIPQGILAPVDEAVEWYRPTPEQVIAMSHGIQEHVRAGGLLSRLKLERRPPLKPGEASAMFRAAQAQAKEGEDGKPSA